MEKLVFYCIFENSKNTVSLYSENKCNLGEHVYLKKSIEPKLLNASVYLLSKSLYQGKQSENK